MTKAYFLKKWSILGYHDTLSEHPVSFSANVQLIEVHCNYFGFPALNQLYYQ